MVQKKKPIIRKLLSRFTVKSLYIGHYGAIKTCPLLAGKEMYTIRMYRRIKMYSIVKLSMPVIDGDYYIYFPLVLFMNLEASAVKKCP